jgi:hypothetical protein
MMSRTPMPSDYTPLDYIKPFLDAAEKDEKENPKLHEHDRYLAQQYRARLADAVAYLDKILIEGQRPHECEFRRYKLLMALGAMSVLASHYTQTPATERQLRKLSDKGAQARRSEQEPIDAIIIAEARLIWPKYRSYTSNRIAGEILPAVNTELTAKGLPPRKQRAIATRLEKLRHLIIN